MISDTTITARIDRLEKKLDDIPLSVIENNPVIKGFNDLLKSFASEVKDIRDKLIELGEEVTTMTQQIISITDHIKDLNTKIEKNMDEVGSLKLSRAMLLGMSAILTTIIIPLAFIVFDRVV